MNKKANIEAIRDRMQGKPPSKSRAAALAGTAGVGAAVLVYRSLRDTGN